MKNSLAVFFLIFSGIVSLTARAFIPPLPSILNAVFEGRKGGGPWLVSFRHRVEPRPGEVTLIEEKWLSDRGKNYFVWSGAGFPRSVGGALDRQGYVLGGKSFPSHSTLFVRYLAGANVEQMRELLLAEQFIRRDLMLEFQPGFTPEGDPQTWDLREHYLRHPEIYLHRLGQVVAIAVAGTDTDSRKRIVYFDRALKGIRRLEWRDGDATVGWTFEGFSGGVPHRLVFDMNGTTVVTSDVASAKSVKERQASELINAWRQVGREAPMTAETEAALRLLLSYR